MIAGATDLDRGADMKMLVDPARPSAPVQCSLHRHNIGLPRTIRPDERVLPHANFGNVNVYMRASFIWSEKTRIIYVDFQFNNS